MNRVEFIRELRQTIKFALSEPDGFDVVEFLQAHSAEVEEIQGTPYNPVFKDAAAKANLTAGRRVSKWLARYTHKAKPDVSAHVACIQSDLDCGSQVDFDSLLAIEKSNYTLGFVVCGRELLVPLKFVRKLREALRAKTLVSAHVRFEPTLEMVCYSPPARTWKQRMAGAEEVEASRFYWVERLRVWLELRWGTHGVMRVWHTDTFLDSEVVTAVWATREACQDFQLYSTED